MENQSLKLVVFLLLVTISNTYCNAVDTISSNNSLCQNNGFIVQSRYLSDVCFCYGTGFYGDYCEIACPEVMPTECIVI